MSLLILFQAPLDLFDTLISALHRMEFEFKVFLRVYLDCHTVHSKAVIL